MTDPFDLKKFFADPQTFSATAADASMISDEVMTEAFIGPLPHDFQMPRAAAHFNELTTTKYTGHPGFLFVLSTENIGAICLFAAFAGAVDKTQTMEDLDTIVRQEIRNGGRNPDNWELVSKTDSRNVYPVLIDNFKNWNP